MMMMVEDDVEGKKDGMQDEKVEDDEISLK